MACHGIGSHQNEQGRQQRAMVVRQEEDADQSGEAKHVGGESDPHLGGEMELAFGDARREIFERSDEDDAAQKHEAAPILIERKTVGDQWRRRDRQPANQNSAQDRERVRAGQRLAEVFARIGHDKAIESHVGHLFEQPVAGQQGRTKTEFPQVHEAAEQHDPYEGNQIFQRADRKQRLTAT